MGFQRKTRIMRAIYPCWRAFSVEIQRYSVGQFGQLLLVGESRQDNEGALSGLNMTENRLNNEPK